MDRWFGHILTYLLTVKLIVLLFQSQPKKKLLLNQSSYYWASSSWPSSLTRGWPDLGIESSTFDKPYFACVCVCVCQNNNRIDYYIYIMNTIEHFFGYCHLNWPTVSKLFQFFLFLFLNHHTHIYIVCPVYFISDAFFLYLYIYDYVNYVIFNNFIQSKVCVCVCLYCWHFNFWNCLSTHFQWWWCWWWW